MQFSLDLHNILIESNNYGLFTALDRSNGVMDLAPKRFQLKLACDLCLYSGYAVFIIWRENM